MIKSWKAQDWMVVGGGFAAFIFSFFNFVGASFDGFSVSINAWHSYAILGLLLIFAAAIAWALLALKVLQIPKLPAKLEVVAAGASGLGTLLIIIRAAAYGDPVGIRFGGILLIIAGFVVTAGAVWALSAGSAAGASGPRPYTSGFPLRRPDAGSPPAGSAPPAPSGGASTPAPPPWSPPGPSQAPSGPSQGPSGGASAPAPPPWTSPPATPPGVPADPFTAHPSRPPAPTAPPSPPPPPE
jgi:hypothetical protein